MILLLLLVFNLIFFQFRESKELGNNSSDEDIFDDLTASHSTKKEYTNKVDASGCCVLKLSQNVLCLHAIRNLILVLSAVQETGYLVTWYSSSKLESHANKPERLQSHKNLGEIFLPRHSCIPVKDNAYFKSPILSCISVEDSGDGAMQGYRISKYLYNDLFGVNNNLMDAEIVLVGLPNGNVYATSLKACEQNCKLVYDLGEPIVGIFPVCFEEELSEIEQVMGYSRTICNCLLLVGGNGKIGCIFRYGNQKDLMSKEVFVPGQVVCCGFVQSTLLLVSDTEFQMVHIGEIQKANKYQYLQCRGLNMFNVRALCTTPAEVGTHLYVLCKRGNVLHKQINFENLESLGVNKRSGGGTNLKDLLTSIGHVSDGWNQARAGVNQVNCVLEQLAIVSAMVANIYSGNILIFLSYIIYSENL